ncbi:MAG TPA: toast rack family protein [Gemmatimonadaceae bacterium]
MKRDLPSLAAAALLALAATAPAGAQEWRSIESSRQLRDTSDHYVKVQYGAGTLDVRATAQPVLYSMRLRYDEEMGTPVSRYDAEARQLTVGIPRQTVKWGRNINLDERTKGEMRLELSPRVPMDLEISLGAAKGELNLGGLTLRSLRLEAGAAETNVHFDAFNPARMRTLELSAGAASFKATGLANANAASIRTKGGVGNIDLDFDGAWTQDIDLDADFSLGSLGLRVPSDVGIRVEMDRFLVSFHGEGMSKRGGAWYSENWESAPHRLTVRVHAALGSVEVERTLR